MSLKLDNVGVGQFICQSALNQHDWHSQQNLNATEAGGKHLCLTGDTKASILYIYRVYSLNIRKINLILKENIPMMEGFGTQVQSTSTQQQSHKQKQPFR